jgi:hypothetical protein
MSNRRSFLAAVATLALASPRLALAWGASGHRLIARLAVEALPTELPRFVRDAGAIEAAGELAREPDRWKSAGRVHDQIRDGAHFLDLGDDGRVFGGPALARLPTTLADYDAQLQAVGTDVWRAGYLPYAILDAWQQLAKDFAYWRIAEAGARTSRQPTHRAWLAADAVRREGLILRSLGVLAHYVGDGSQPLHVTVHFNGWGSYPNSEGFTEARVHARFEGVFVRDNVGAVEVRAAMVPFSDCDCPLEARIAAYLGATNTQVTPLYRLYKAGGFEPGDPRGRKFTAMRLAAGASELRDLTILAWRTSATLPAGFPGVTVAEVLAGKVDPFDSFYGLD